jgi:very-short-patch-repair endonuclease
MSALEATFDIQCRHLGVPNPVHEHRFHKVRRWRFDRAWPDEMVAAEIEGGTRGNGRHNRHAGYSKDCEKYNAATELGWRVFRFTSDQVNDWSGANLLARVLAGGED